MKCHMIGLPVYLNSPCKDCGDRYPACHSKCEKYLEFRTKLKEYQEEERRQIDLDHITNQHRKRINKFDRSKRSIG